MLMHDFVAALDPEALLPEILETLKMLVSWDTVRREALPGMPFGKNNAEALHRFLELAGAEGFRTVNVDNYCGYLEYGTGEEMVAVACHLDVVPPGELADWKTPPFEMTRIGDDFYGRGVADNKGPLAIIWQLMRELKKHDVKLKRRLRFIVGCGEETGSECLTYYRRHEEIPRYAIVPDVSYPIVCGEYGVFRFALEKRFKPGENRLNLKAGVVVNAIPAHAEAEFDGRHYSAEGRAGHASRPHLGDNALVKLCTELNGKVDSDFPALVCRANRAGFDLELDDEYSHLTLVPSVAEVDAEHAVLKCDIRFPVTMRIADIKARLEKTIAGTGYSLSVISSAEPLYFPPDTPFISKLSAAYGEFTGDYESKPRVNPGSTYAKRLPTAVAFGCSLPGCGGNVHAPNERWNIRNLLVNQRIMARAIEVLDGLK